MGAVSPVALAAIAGIVLFLLASGIRVIREFERGVVLRLGTYTGTAKGPGLVFIIPGVDRMTKVDLRVVARDVPPQDVITRDNVSVKVNAVIYFRVVHPDKAILNVENYLFATSQYAQTTLRAILGQVELDDLLSARERINQQLQEVIDRHTDPWGVKVTSVELKHVDLPTEMQRAMARQAEAERYRRAKVIAAEGEQQASVQARRSGRTIIGDRAGRHDPAVSADPSGDRRREQLDHPIPHPHRSAAGHANQRHAVCPSVQLAKAEGDDEDQAAPRPADADPALA